MALCPRTRSRTSCVSEKCDTNEEVILFLRCGIVIILVPVLRNVLLIVSSLCDLHVIIVRHSRWSCGVESMEAQSLLFVDFSQHPTSNVITEHTYVCNIYLKNLLLKSEAGGFGKLFCSINSPSLSSGSANISRA